MRRLTVMALAMLAAACAQQPVYGPPPYSGTQPPTVTGPDRLNLVPADYRQLPGWREDTAAAVLPALMKSCARITKMPVDKAIGPDGAGGTAADWYTPCGAAQRLSVNDHDGARAFFETFFQPMLATNNGQADGMFTGYYEPELRGSRTRRGSFTVPLLSKPRDLVVRDQGGEQVVGRMVGERLVPYPTRAEIEAGALGSQAFPLLWLDDPVDAHILHIQGSGRIRLDDGTVVRVGVAGTNGHKFVGIGKILRDRGLVQDSSMPGVRAWLKANPADAQRLMAENPRYVFYRIVAGTEGPLGAEGVALTPERSLAVDTRYIPLGVPLWLDTVEPSGRPLRRLMVAQDTGSAIRGPVRGDFFWGPGEPAFEKAGRMKSQGRYWLLVPRQRSPRIALAN